MDELDSPNEFPIFSETFSISKIYIESIEEIVIRNVLIQAYFFRSKQALENPVNLAILCGDNIEEKLVTPFNKIIDFAKGTFELFPSEYEIYIPPQDMIGSFPYRVGYQAQLEFGTDPQDYLTVTESNYFNASANVLLRDETIAQYYLVQGATFSDNREILIKNSNQSQFLYIIPFVPKIQKTLLASSGRINFEVDF